MMNDDKIILKLKEEPLLFDFGDILLKMIDIENINQNIAENLQFCTIPASPASYEYKIEILSRQKRIHENPTNRAAIKILQNQFLTQSRTYLSPGSGNFFTSCTRIRIFLRILPILRSAFLSQQMNILIAKLDPDSTLNRSLFIMLIQIVKKNCFLIFGQ